MTVVFEAFRLGSEGCVDWMGVGVAGGEVRMGDGVNDEIGEKDINEK